MSQSPLSLIMDTTGKTLILALAQGESLIQSKAIESTSHRYHSAILIPEITRLLQENHYQTTDLTRIITNIGPGSFTGIRTGLTTVRTMAQFLPVTVVTLNAFTILAKAYTLSGKGEPEPESQRISIDLDALQGNSYHACLGIDNSLQNSQSCWHTEPILQAVKEPDYHACSVIASQSLQDKGLIPNAITAESLTSHIAQAMATLSLSAEPTPWQQVVPLYLQEPNITLRKPKSGALRP